jgi:hypothetical protein
MEHQVRYALEVDRCLAQTYRQARLKRPLQTYARVGPVPLTDEDVPLPELDKVEVSMPTEEALLTTGAVFPTQEGHVSPLFGAFDGTFADFCHDDFTSLFEGVDLNEDSNGSW